MTDSNPEIENQKLKILLVDDNEQDRYMLQVLLEGHGYEVVPAANGAEALDAARRGRPDMIITDILMPMMDGFTLCRQWKQDEQLKEIPFVFYSATYTDPKDEDFALSLGAERFIVKPAEPDVFAGMVQEIIQEHEAGRLVAPREPVEEETIYLREYNEALIRKLEDKMIQLQETNQEVIRQRDRLQLLHRIDRTISSTLDLPELLDQLAAELMSVLGVNRCNIWLLDESGEFLTGRAYGQPGEPGVEGIRLPRDEALVVRLFETREPLIVPDVSDPAYADVVNPEYVAAFDVQAFLAVPLVQRDRVTGILVLDDTRAPRVFQPAEIELAQSVGVQAAIAIENARLFEEVVAHNAQLRRLDRAIEQAAEAVVITDPQGEIEYVNPAFERITGYSRDEALGQNPRILKSGKHDRAFYRQMWETILAGKVWHGSLINRKKSGELYHEEMTIAPVLAESGTVVNFVAVKRDITERVRAEEHIQLQLQRLAALHNIDMAITASVDLRVPLNILLDHVTTQLGVDAADILRLNVYTHTLEYAAGVGFRTDALRYTRLRLGDGHAGRAALERRRIEIPNLAEEAGDLTRALQMAGESFTSYYGVPLVAKGRVLGVMEIFHRSPLAPDPEWFRFLEALATQAAIAIDNAALFEDLQRSNLELTLAYDMTLEGWARALELRDQETEGHARRVTELTLRLAHAMGMRDEELVHIRRGVLLHDIGKMGIRDSILLKPGELNDEEWEIMRQHPVYAYELLLPIPFLRPALDIPYCHHERWDGKGYPQGLKGKQIPLPARVFAVVDVYDALRSDRPYRKAWTEEQAREYIREQAGKHFDPQVVQAFLDLLEMDE
jgi:PAS domain S-box-containing protein